MGMMWRIRGAAGWGSEWGVLNAGFMFTMFVLLVKGEREKMNLWWFALTCVAFIATTPAWGTFLGQIIGYFHYTTVEIPVYSAVLIMFVLGFGLASLYGIALGRGFSGRKWKIQHVIVLIAVFIGVNMLSRTCVSHWILDLIQPQAGKLFESVASENGLSGSAYSLYMSHFSDISWAKKVCDYAGRNYYASVSTISMALAGIAARLVTRFFVKDKKAANISLVCSGAFGFGITVSDIFFFFEGGGYHGSQGLSLPSNMMAWSLWEYFTGFFAGAVITAALLKMKPGEDVHEPAFDFAPKKLKSFFTFLLGYFGVFGVNFVRPIYVRFENSPTGVIIAVSAAALIAALAIIFAVSKKIGHTAEKGGMTAYVKIMFPLMMCYITVVYFFIAEKAEQSFRSFTMLHNILVAVSAAAALLWYFTSASRCKKASS